MSGSNPFRRDRPFAPTSTSTPLGPEDGDPDASVCSSPLNIDTSSTRATNQTKHVQFASPPAPETPLSYSYPSSSASSPEPLRHPGPPSPYLARPVPRVPASADPFHSDDSDTSNERSDEGNPRASSGEPAIATSASRRGPAWPPVELHSSLDSVQTTSELSLADSGSEPPPILGQAPPKGKQAIDVDAFKRLLLTGESGMGAPSGAVVPPVSATNPLTPGDSSSSSADSASVSRQSIFEPLTSMSTETPRTSHELDFDDASLERRGLSNSVAPQGRQKPSVPRTRHGKKLTEPNLVITAATASVGIENAPSVVVPTPTSPSPATGGLTDLDKPLPLPLSPPSLTDIPSPIAPSDSQGLGISLPARTKRPPTPPLTRRQSQMKGTKPQLTRKASSRTAAVEEANLSEPTDLRKFPSMMKAPPPPPQRRLNRTSTYGSLGPEVQWADSDTARTPSASSLGELPLAGDTGSQQCGDLPPQPFSSASRPSAIVTATASPAAPPPLPPPRRMRGLSKSSVDSQRPASLDLRRPSTESGRNVSGASNASDILADLAALQREVDALRNSQGGKRVS